MRHRGADLLREARTGLGLSYKILRFAVVGGLSSLLYVLLVAFYVEIFGSGERWAAVLAYLTMLPINFIAHRCFTFRTVGHVWVELPRFALLHLCNIAVSLGGMIGAVEGFGLSYWFGAFAAAILVPMSTFLVMNFWVFVVQGRT